MTRRIWLLSAVMLVNRAGTMVLAFMTLYCTQYKHFSYSQAGWVVGFYGLGAVTGAFIGGKISDRFGFYYVQALSLLMGGISFFILGFMQTYIAICICSFCLSLVNESFRPANASAISHYSTPENRTKSFSLVRLAINLGWGIGSALGGILSSINYKLLFWVDGSTNILAAILLLVILPVVSITQQKKNVLDKPKTKKDSPFRDRHFMYYIGFKLIFAMCFFQLFTTVPIYFKDDLHISEFWYGMVSSLNGVMIAVFEMVLVSKLEGKRPYLHLISLGSVLMAISFILLNFTFLNSLVLAFSAIIILTLAEMIAMPFMNTWYISRSNEHNRGQYAAVYTMAWSAAQVIGSTTGAQAAHAVGFRDLWYIIAGLSLVAAGGYWWLLKKV